MTGYRGPGFDVLRRYVDLEREAPRGLRTEGISIKPNRSCESVEALSASSWSDFEPYPMVCPSPRACDARRGCLRRVQRLGVIYRARLAVLAARSGSWAPPIAR